MSRKPNSVALIGTCSQCGTEVQIIVTKQELKAILKGFKLPVKEAQRYSEEKIRRIQKRYK